MNVDVLYSRLRRGVERFLSFRPRTKSEIEKYILRKISSLKDLELNTHEILEDLLKEYSQQITSDEDFIKWWIEERAFFKPKSKNILKYELLQKGVSRDVLDTFFEAYVSDEIAQINRFFERRGIKIDDHLNDKEYMKKLVAKLQRRGFSYSDIKNAIDQSIKRK